jgi:hypothetical protein
MTIHIGWPEFIILGFIILLGLVSTLMKLLRSHGEEFVEFLEWSDRMKTRIKNIGGKNKTPG